MGLLCFHVIMHVLERKTVYYLGYGRRLQPGNGTVGSGVSTRKDYCIRLNELIYAVITLTIFALDQWNRWQGMTDTPSPLLHWWPNPLRVPDYHWIHPVSTLLPDIESTVVDRSITPSQSLFPWGRSVTSPSSLSSLSFTPFPSCATLIDYSCFFHVSYSLIQSPPSFLRYPFLFPLFNSPYLASLFTSLLWGSSFITLPYPLNL